MEEIYITTYGRNGGPQHFPFSQPNCFKDLGRSAMIWVWNGGL